MYLIQAIDLAIKRNHLIMQILDIKRIYPNAVFFIVLGRRKNEGNLNVLLSKYLFYDAFSPKK